MTRHNDGRLSCKSMTIGMVAIVALWVIWWSSQAWWPVVAGWFGQ